jgi:hypothetical protein
MRRNKFQKLGSGSRPRPGVFLFSNTQSESLYCAFPRLVWIRWSRFQLSVTTLFAGSNIGNDP